MTEPSQPPPREPQEFSVRITSKIQHEILAKAVDQCGGISALAERLGVSYYIISGWLNLRRMPNISSGKVQSWWRKRWPGVEKRLHEVTGRKTEEIFPDFVRCSGLLEADKERVEVREIPASHWKGLENRASRETLRLPPPIDSVVLEELKDGLEGALQKLNYRQREIIKMRYGLDPAGGGYIYSCAECGRILGMAEPRVRQVEATALRKLQCPTRSQDLEKFLA